LRDLFGLLFFVSVGMLIDPRFLLANLGTVALLVVLVGLGKGIIFAAITRLAGYGNVVPLAAALGLFQVGEFSFVLGRVGVATGSIGHDVFALVLTTAVVTMLLTPPISGLTAPLYLRRRRRSRAEPLQTINLPERGLRDHVVIAGGGRVGLDVARVLTSLGLPCVVVELDTRRVEMAKESGIPVVFGDATQEAVLEAACIAQARLVLVTIPGVVESRAAIVLARRLNNAIHVVARAASASHVAELRQTGVFEVVQPEFEAGLEMTRQALLHLGVPPDRVDRQADEARRAFYAPPDPPSGA